MHKAKRIQIFLTTHWVAFALALIVGVLSCLPGILAVRSLGNAYQGIPFLYQDNDDTYLVRIREITDGFRRVSSPMLYEYKNAPNLLLPIGEYVYVGLSTLTGFSVETVAVSSTFFFPVALFLLIYFFIFLLSNERYRKFYALGAALFILLGYDLVDVHHAVSIFLGHEHTVYLSIWTRLVNPVTGALFLFSFLSLFYVALRTLGKRSLWCSIAAAAMLALMSGYYFTFALALAFMALLSFIFLIEKDWRSFFITLCIGAVGVLPNVLYIFSVLRKLSSSGSADAVRNGLFFTHEPLFNKLTFLALLCIAVILVYLYRVEKTAVPKLPLRFIIALPLSGLIALNEQVLTGRAIWPQHFVQYSIPFSVAALAILVSYICSLRIRKMAMVIFTLIGLFSVLLSICALPTYKNVLEDFKDMQRYAPIFSWLKNNTGDRCVVLPVEAVERMGRLIPAYTSCDVYMSSYSFIGVPYERVYYNYLVYMRLMGVEPKNARRYLKDNRDSMRIALFEDWKEMFRHTDNPWLIKISDRKAIDAHFDDVAEQVAKEYALFYAKDFKESLKRFRVDFIVNDGNVYPWKAPAFLTPVFSKEGITLYAFK